MNKDSSLTCICGRSFALPGGLAYHHRSCKKSKVRLAGALRTAKDAWTNRKRCRFEAVQAEHKNVSQQDVNSESTMEVHEANIMDQAVTQSLNEDEMNGLASQPGPVIEPVEVLYFYVGLGLITLKGIFRKLPCPWQSVGHVG